MAEESRKIIRPFFGEVHFPEFNPKSTEDWKLQGLELSNLILNYNPEEPFNSQPTLAGLHPFFNAILKLPLSQEGISKQLDLLNFNSASPDLDVMKDITLDYKISTSTFWVFNLNFIFPDSSKVQLDHLRIQHPKSLFFKHISNSLISTMQLDRIHNFWQIRRTSKLPNKI